MTRAIFLLSRLISLVSPLPLAFGAANFFFHSQSECWLTPRRCETSETGYVAP
jgi:hypothetical protein